MLQYSGKRAVQARLRRSLETSKISSADDAKAAQPTTPPQRQGKIGDLPRLSIAFAILSRQCEIVS